MKSMARQVRALKCKCEVLHLALRHTQTPWYAKTCGLLTLLYALSPIDLVPDFIPVLGYLDDLVVVPFGIWLTMKLVPANVWRECEDEVARRELEERPKDWRGAIFVILIWIALLCAGLVVLKRFLSS